jgi:hypothetical protein
LYCSNSVPILIPVLLVLYPPVDKLSVVEFSKAVFSDLSELFIFGLITVNFPFIESSVIVTSVSSFIPRPK